MLGYFQAIISYSYNSIALDNVVLLCCGLMAQMTYEGHVEPVRLLTLFLGKLRSKWLNST